jgi:hypothetical protein
MEADQVALLLWTMLQGRQRVTNSWQAYPRKSNSWEVIPARQVLLLSRFTEASIKEDDCPVVIPVTNATANRLVQSPAQ